MRRWIWVLALAAVVVLPGCFKKQNSKKDKPANTQASVQDASQAAPEPAPESQPATNEPITMKSIDLYLHNSAPTSGSAQKPSFWVHAESFSTIDQKEFFFEKARAVIYSHAGKATAEGKLLPMSSDVSTSTSAQKAAADQTTPADEEIVLEANSGQCRQSEKAYLKDGVTAYVRDMKIELVDIEWLNEKREAHSEKPVIVNGKQAQLHASSLRLFPDKKMLELTNVSGTVQLEREGQ